jgi:phenylalanyl-tRNA synthetase beta chain
VKLSLNWLRDYVALDAPVAELTRAITFLGFEVEQVLTAGAPALPHVVVGEVLTRAPHPNADRLSVCTVDLGPGAAGGVRTIVCGAQNYRVGDRVPVALPGAVLPGNFAIKSSKIRGQLSDGMMCSGRELGLADEVDGLLILTDRPAPGTPINAVLPPPDTVFDVEITPNRPDCLSHLGLARELAAWFRLPLEYPPETFLGQVGPLERPDLLRRVRVDAPADCPLYSAHVIAGVRIAPSPAWLQQRLRAVGLRPINNVVDVGNYVMLEYGQPLHAFDARKLAGAEIIVRRAAEGERITTLDGRERTLGAQTLVIADAAKALVVAGIMGGANSGIDETTTDLVIEGAVFRPQSIRRTSRALGLASDSSYRYERGVDPHLAREAARRAVALILQTAGGEAVGPILAVGGDVPWSREITVDPAFLRERAGFDLPDAGMRASLEALELKVVRVEPTAAGGVRWTVSIPSWRDDLDRPIDLVEEVLRLHGTENIPPARVTAPGLVAEDDPVVRFNRQVTAYLVGHDFHECENLTLRPAAELSTWISQAAAAELALANPFVADQSHLRPSLVMGLLETLRLNQSRGVAASRLAEVGRVFIEDNGVNYECAAVAFVVAEDRRRLWRAREAFDFYAARHHTAALAAFAGVDLDASAAPADGAGGDTGAAAATAAARPAAPGGVPASTYAWQEGQSAALGGFAAGWFARCGMIDLALARSLALEGRVFAGVFAILPERLASAAAATARPRYRELSLFPATSRDLALVVDAAASAGEVRGVVARIARAAAGAAVPLESVEVFDVYTGPGLPPGARSLAFGLVFRSPARTLTDEEVNAVLARVQDEIARTTPYQLRAAAPSA